MNKHLNLFNFFSYTSNQYYENNLSRAFALCLKHDPFFLSRILEELLGKELYSELFNTDHPNQQIEIDLQKDVTKWEGLTRVIAVACSGLEINPEEIEKTRARETPTPTTDVTIQIHDVGMLFEFKRTYEDCKAQLKRQAEAIPQLERETEICYRDFSWSKVVSLALNVMSFQKQSGKENPFTHDFLQFLERRHPDWFPQQRPLKNIPFPNFDEDPNHFYLNHRLRQIKRAVFGEESFLEVGSRTAISVNFGWANEVHVDPFKGEQAYLALIFYPGDTKGQGRFLYRQGQDVRFPNQLQGFQLQSGWYLKFSHFNSGVTWLNLTEEESRLTHNADFYLNTGRKRKPAWPAFISQMNNLIPNWQERTDWQRHFEHSNRSYFDVSAGIKLAVLIPYKTAQDLDDHVTTSKLVETLRGLILELKEKIDGKN